MGNVFHVEGDVNQGSALEQFVSAVLPLLTAYGVRVSPEQLARLGASHHFPSRFPRLLGALRRIAAGLSDDELRRDLLDA